MCGGGGGGGKLRMVSAADGTVVGGSASSMGSVGGSSGSSGSVGGSDGARAVGGIDARTVGGGIDAREARAGSGGGNDVRVVRFDGGLDVGAFAAMLSISMTRSSAEISTSGSTGGAALIEAPVGRSLSGSTSPLSTSRSTVDVTSLKSSPSTGAPTRRNETYVTCSNGSVTSPSSLAPM